MQTTGYTNSEIGLGSMCINGQYTKKHVHKVRLIYFVYNYITGKLQENACEITKLQKKIYQNLITNEDLINQLLKKL